ncbi:glycine betaine ABC transporter substrate-binding protein [Pengzhenrongella sicca]|uniref:Glycine betaine ABC transporter substrate-binding protein n=1 Tax=Pengzhenrongella sicca TaxID=2819238 RepID=A0A8A4ZG54_9MICO|nr:glycine betaine ABC transporter substrate-binding protein [Pengzhenrongella sicca]QTE30265.1 glycine betaine ABC transporter substrate-binding protein [Pengzhenrongella sicca]
MTAHLSRPLALTASAAALALLLGACASGEADAADLTPGGDQKDLTIAIHNGWDEGIAASYLWQAILADEGYEVELETADPGIVYTGIAGGDFDVNFDMWLPVTHADYLEKYGDDLEQLGSWYDDARLTIAVNEDSPLVTIADLATQGDVVDNRLVGIEPGAGLTRITKDEVIPTYGLEDLDFVESSTPAMLAELSGAIDADRNIAVTLWRPHWAYDAFPLRDLEDPEGTLGEAENIEMVGRTGFGEDYPELASWLAQFTLTSDELFTLENLMFNENGGDDNEGSAAQWLEENPEFVTTLKAAADKA